MQQCMTQKERIKDISNISGFSEDIVKAVIEAEIQSTINSLKKGERVVLQGRSVFTTFVDNQLDGTLVSKRIIRVLCKPNESIVKAVNEDADTFSIKEEEVSSNVAAYSLSNFR